MIAIRTLRRGEAESAFCVGDVRTLVAIPMTPPLRVYLVASVADHQTT
jgi:hypothetical protein